MLYTVQKRLGVSITNGRYSNFFQEFVLVNLQMDGVIKVGYGKPAAIVGNFI